MFDCREGGDSVPIQWSKDNLMEDKSIIILDEVNQVIWLWNGTKQGLVARRTALRQAESLKGHGYTIGKSIIGRDIRNIIEIDQRKIGRVPETDADNNKLQEILNKKFRELEGYVITFSSEAAGVSIPAAKPATPQPKVPEPKPTEVKLPKPVVKTDTAPKTEPVIKTESDKKEESPKEEARIAFVIKAVLDHFDDIWVSKKKDNSYAIEMMDGPVCTLTVTEEGNIKFSANSFTNINPNIKAEIQKKFVDLSKLI